MDRPKAKKFLGFNRTKTSDISCLRQPGSDDDARQMIPNEVIEGNIDIYGDSTGDTISSDHNIPIPRRRNKHLLQKSRAFDTRVGLRRSKNVSENIEMFDSSDSVSCSTGNFGAPKSIETVVDVHKESTRNEYPVIHSVDERHGSKSGEELSKSSRSGNLKTTFNNVIDNEIVYRSPSSSAREDSIKYDLTKDSKDTRIEYFATTDRPVSDSKGESFGEDIEETLPFRRNDSNEEPRRRRRRWSKGGNPMQVARDLIRRSSDVNSSRKGSPQYSKVDREKVISISETKKKLKCSPSDTSSAYDNAAFQSDPDEVLRIVTEVLDPQETLVRNTDKQRSTKIKLISLSNNSKSFESESTSSVKSTDQGDTKVTTSIEEIANSFYNGSERRASKNQSRDNERYMLNSRLKGRSKNKSDNIESAYEKSESEENDDSDSPYEDNEIRSTDRDRLHRNSPKSKEGRSANYSCSKTRNYEESHRSRSKSVEADTTSISLTDISDLPKRKRRKSNRSRTRHQVKSESSSKEDTTRVGISDSDRKKKRRSKCQYNISNVDEESIESDLNRDDKFISVMIHRADMLETDFATKQPMVKVHIVGIDSGNYLKISDDPNSAGCKFVQPLTTKKFDFEEHQSAIPNWENELIFEYDFDRLIRETDEPVIILFELIDLWHFTEANLNYDLIGREGCWHKICWAFLRPLGLNGVLHVNKKIRLQLYRPIKLSNKSGRPKCEVYNWWKLKQLEKYPSSLYVTIQAIEVPLQEPIVYEHVNLNELTVKPSENTESIKKTLDLLGFPKSNRLDAQSCKIPNNDLFQSELFENGCFYVTFSNDGKYLACVTSGEHDHSIVIYTIPEWSISARITGHKNFIYALNWSHDDEFLLSVSSDQTACVWNIRQEIVTCVQMLPHPSYVYCGKFDPRNKRIIATGCFDRVTRIWARCKNRKHYELIQELEVHKGYVNSLCFQRDGGLITADSVGVIVLWTIRKKRHRQFEKEWHLLRQISIREIEHVVINTIILHPLESRLLVHSRDNGLRMLDLATCVVLKKYNGLRNQRLQTAACLSPCGRLIFCGGEDSYVNVWDLENGTHLAKYFIPDAKIVAHTDYHPSEHILTLSTFSNPGSIRVLNFRKDATGEKVGLIISKNRQQLFGCDDSDDIHLSVSSNSKKYRNNVLQSYTARSKSEIERKTSSNPSLHRMRRNLKPLSYSPKPTLSTGVEDQSETSYNGPRSSTKFRIERIQDLEYNLKSTSIRKLNSIIEKIDRILVGTTFKHDDLKQSSTDIRAPFDQESYGSEKFSNEKRRRIRRRKELRSDIPDKDEQPLTRMDYAIEMYDDNATVIDMRETSFMHLDPRDSKTIACPSSSKHDSPYRVLRDTGYVDNFSTKNINNTSGSKVDDTNDKDTELRHESDSDIVSDDSEKSESVKDRLHTDTSTPNSTGTYIIKRNENHKSDELSSHELDRNDRFSESGVIFTIEKEIPVPKPRKKTINRQIC